MPDAHALFAKSTVATAPVPATSGTSLVVAAGDGALMPAVPFNAVIWPAGVQPSSTNAEIVRVTARSTDTLTITRAQEGTSARTVIVGDQIHAGPTKKWWSDIEGGRVTFSNANYVALPADRVVAQIGTMSASRTVTLPAANSVPAGWVITIVDESNTAGGLNSIAVARAGADTINLGTASLAIVTAGGALRLESDNVSNWSTVSAYESPLSIGRGGTGQITAGAAADALLGTSTRGDLPYRGTSAIQRLAKGTSGQFLKIGANDPAWANIVASDVGNSYSAVGTDHSALSRTNPTALTSLLNAAFALTPSSVAVDDVFEITAGGYITNNAANSAVEFELLLGANVLFDYTTSTTLTTSGNPRRWFISVRLEIRNSGASGNLMTDGLVVISSAGATGAAPIELSGVAGTTGGFLAVMSGNVTAIDFTSSMSFDLQARFVTSSAAATFQCRSFRISKLAA